MTFFQDRLPSCSSSKMDRYDSSHDPLGAVASKIIKCNNRQFGDIRIYASFMDSSQRDPLRVKVGIIDCCVIGEIDVQALCDPKNNHRSPANRSSC